MQIQREQRIMSNTIPSRILEQIDYSPFCYGIVLDVLDLEFIYITALALETEFSCNGSWICVK